MTDESGAAEAVESPESVAPIYETEEDAPSIEERLGSLEQHVAAALAGAASGAEISAQLAEATEVIHARVDGMEERFGELAALVAGHVARAGAPIAEAIAGAIIGADGEERPLFACPACGRLVEGDAESCPRCGAELAGAER